MPGRTLLLVLHGLACRPDDYRPFADALGRLLGVDALAPALPGADGTRLPAGSAATLDALASSARDALDGAGASQVILVGHSLGGAVGTLLAVHDPRVACFANLEGNLVASDAFLSRRIAAAAGAELERLLRRTLPDEFERAGGPAGSRYAAHLRATADPASLAAVAAALAAASADGSLLSAWRSLRLPKLYLYGGRSANPEALAALDADGATTAGQEKGELAGFGHFPHLEGPDALARRIAERFSGLGSRFGAGSKDG